MNNLSHMTTFDSISFSTTPEKNTWHKASANELNELLLAPQPFTSTFLNCWCSHHIHIIQCTYTRNKRASRWAYNSYKDYKCFKNDEINVKCETKELYLLTHIHGVSRELKWLMRWSEWHCKIALKELWHYLGDGMCCDLCVVQI